MKMWRTVALICIPLLAGVLWLGVELASLPTAPALGGTIHVVNPMPGPAQDDPVVTDPGGTGAITVPPVEPCLAGDDTDDDDPGEVPDVDDCED